jgi:hypothetical protein
MHATLVRTIVAAVLATLAATVLPAEAQWRGSNAQAQGYNDGADAGSNDARNGRPFEYQRHRAYREADRGYEGRFGNRDDYKQQYRAGFVAGYRDSYYSEDSRGPAGRAGRPSLGGGSTYGGPGRSGGPGYGRGRNPGADIASARGLDDGYRKGFEDGRDRDRRDPWRHRWYRDGDRGYRGSYGPRAWYERAYRSAFEQGYDQGYADGRQRRGWGGIVWRQ